MIYSQVVLEKATQVADECQGSHLSYCTARCPMHTEAMEYVNLIGEGDVKGALLKIREKVFLPGTLGRICAHPCEDVCRRETEFGQGISIAALKRYAADKEDKEELWDISKKDTTNKKVAVVGAGPAGAQAAIDLAKEGHTVTIYEKLDVVGGMMRVGIPAYRLPRNVIDFEYSYLDKLGITFKKGVEIGVDLSFAQLQDNYDAVVIANGAHKSFIPPMEGVDSKGVTNAVDFLKSASLEEDSLKVGENVIVIGGGDVAMDCARSARRLGGKKVTLVSLEKEEELPASKHEQVGAKEEGIIFKCGFGGDSLVSGNGNVTGINLKECTSVFDDNGRFSPSYSDKVESLSCDTLIFATGQLTEDITDGALEQGGGGRYLVDKETLATKIDKVFVAGDNGGATIVVEAMALGRKAAISVNRYLKGEDLKAGRDFQMEYSFESKLDIPLPEDTQDLPRRYTNMMDKVERVKTFAECDLGFTDEMAKEEGSRCLECECKQCMKECIMLNDFTEYPGMLFAQFLIDGKVEPLLAYSCNMCDQCTIACPEEFKFAEIFGAMRKDLVKANNGESPMPGHKAINMHQKLGFSKLFAIRCKGGKK
jgi:NADPH-dependent glutamate synthase beta subunit-like oxidoreductase